VIARKERRLPNNARRFFPQSPDSSGEILPSIQAGFLLFIRHSLIVTFYPPEGVYGDNLRPELEKTLYDIYVDYINNYHKHAYANARCIAG
jgi:hypothetical protein